MQPVAASSSRLSPAITITITELAWQPYRAGCELSATPFAYAKTDVDCADARVEFVPVRRYNNNNLGIFRGATITIDASP